MCNDRRFCVSLCNLAICGVVEASRTAESQCFPHLPPFRDHRSVTFVTFSCFLPIFAGFAVPCADIQPVSCVDCRPPKAAATRRRQVKKMKIRMSAEQVAGLFEFAMLQDLDPTSMEPMKVSRDSAELKLVDGKPVFRVRVTALDRESGREMDAVSLRIKSKPQAKIGRTFDLKLAGQVTVTPYVTSANRLGWSIVADGLAEK